MDTFEDVWAQHAVELVEQVRERFPETPVDDVEVVCRELFEQRAPSQDSAEELKRGLGRVLGDLSPKVA